jgi:hypothetical protein
LENGESILNGTDGEFDFTRDEAGTVTITASDDDGIAALTVEPGGAAALTLGENATTTVSILSDGAVTLGGTSSTTIRQRGTGEFALQNNATGSLTQTWRDWADTTDVDMNHVVETVNCTDASTGAEDCDYSIQVTEAGANRTALTIDADGDYTFPPEPADGGNGDNQHRIIGIPKLGGFVTGVMNDASETTNVDFGDSETPNTDWTQTANITTSDDSTFFRKGTASLKYLIAATPADGNGADCDLAGATGAQDWSADESFGLWMYCTIAATDGDEWALEITDSVAGATEALFPAYTTANTWQWMEVDISGVADASKDVVNSIAIDLTAAGATDYAAGGDCYFDYMWKWDSATGEEVAMSIDILEDGVVALFGIPQAAGTANVPILLTEGTDFFVHYEAGNDFIVPITDQSLNAGWGMAALE